MSFPKFGDFDKNLNGKQLYLYNCNYCCVILNQLSSSINTLYVKCTNSMQFVDLSVKFHFPTVLQIFIQRNFLIESASSIFILKYLFIILIYNSFLFSPILPRYLRQGLRLKVLLQVKGFRPQRYLLYIYLCVC